MQSQDKSLEVRYTKNIDFTDEVAEKFMRRDIRIKDITEQIANQQKKLPYVNPYFD